MENTLRVGTVVENFGQIARVVGHHAASDNWPILKSFRSNGKLYGGKWVADPSKCRVIEEAK